MLDTIVKYIIGLVKLKGGTDSTIIGNVSDALKTSSVITTGDANIGRVKITDGTDVADVLDLANSNPLTVAIVDGSGTQLTSIGGGTQYTEDDVDATIVGNALLAEVTATSTLKTVQTKLLGTQLANTDYGTITQSVVHGLNSSGGGTYVDVKVNPSGSLEVNTNQDTHDNLNANVNLQVANTDVSSGNPVPVDVMSGIPEMVVINAISSTAFDLSAGPYSVASAVADDYILDHIQFNFTTTQARTITVTASDGTVLWSATSDTSLNIILEDIDKAFNGGDNFTIAVTQAAGACVMDVLATIRQGSLTLGTNPTLAGRTVISSLNSTSTPLNAAAVFTGTWEDVTEYTSMIIATKTDQNGTFTIQFSPDGTNADSTLTRYYRTNQIEAPHRFTITRKYMRVVFTNTSASNQTYLRLQVSLGDYGDLNTPLDSTLSQDYDSLSVRPTKYEYEVALGRRQGATTWNLFGGNIDVDTGTSEVMANFGGSFTPMTTARTLSVVSTSVNDTSAGTGARSLVVYGVDANRASQIVVVTLNGTTPVVTTETWLGVNRVAIYLAGSALSNEGVITLTATTDLTTQAQIAVGEGASQSCIFFTSADHQALADFLLVSAEKLTGGTQPIVTFRGWVYSAVSNAKYLVFRHVMDVTVVNDLILNPNQPFVIGEKSCFWLEVETTQNNTEVNGRLSLIEVRDVDA